MALATVRPAQATAIRAQNRLASSEDAAVLQLTSASTIRERAWTPRSLTLSQDRLGVDNSIDSEK
eukprot:IDg1169t1